MPTNIFGEQDNYNLQTSHFIPALIRKIDTAIKKGKTHLEVWVQENLKEKLCMLMI